MDSLLETHVETVVQTSAGAVCGRSDGGVLSFKGIPYAAPPFGANRLRPPAPVAPWTGVRDALEYGPKVPQVPFPSPWDVLLADRAPQGEDCLNLNVWTRDLESPSQPVMVFIPGGMFESGTAAMDSYDGTAFAHDGVVLVSINYRVGAEGFLALDDGGATRGLLDQVAALEWVQENIASFGGDPANVTVYGQSAGAMSIGTLLAMPRAAGLFRRAIVQSGGSHQVASRASAQHIERRLAEILGIEARRDAFAAVPLDRFLEAQTMLKAEIIAKPDPGIWGADVALTILPWQPVIDEDVVSALPIARIAAGAGADVDLLVGSNLDEWNFFTAPASVPFTITDEMVAGMITAYGLPLGATLATYRELRPDATPADHFAALQGDYVLRIPALRLAEEHAKSTTGTTHAFEFAWRSPQYGGRLGACHGLEIPFVFDTLPKDGDADSLVGPNPPHELARTMHDVWVAFAVDGRCNWTAYDHESRSTMRFDTPCRIVNDPQSAERVLWEGVR
jgi:carboxylesterase type B